MTVSCNLMTEQHVRLTITIPDCQKHSWSLIVVQITTNTHKKSLIRNVGKIVEYNCHFFYPYRTNITNFPLKGEESVVKWGLEIMFIGDFEQWIYAHPVGFWPFCCLLKTHALDMHKWRLASNPHSFRNVHCAFFCAFSGWTFSRCAFYLSCRLNLRQSGFGKTNIILILSSS